MSVGLLVVRLKYGLYVGHLSKLAFQFMFKVVCLVIVVSSFRLACNVSGFVKTWYIPSVCLATNPPRRTIS